MSGRVYRILLYNRRSTTREHKNPRTILAYRNGECGSTIVCGCRCHRLVLSLLLVMGGGCHLPGVYSILLSHLYYTLVSHYTPSAGTGIAYHTDGCTRLVERPISFRFAATIYKWRVFAVPQILCLYIKGRCRYDTYNLGAALNWWEHYEHEHELEHEHEHKRRRTTNATI